MEMLSLNLTWDDIIPFLVVLSVLIFVHEMGHFLVARLFGVRVEVFSIGFGREIYGWNDRAGTRWKIGWLPMGGYLKMFGMAEPMDEKAEDGTDEDERPMTPEERAVSFRHKHLAQRTAIIAAGPIANFLFAILVFAGLFSFAGMPYLAASVGEVIPNSAAAEAGMEPGDRILSIDGAPVKEFDDLLQIVKSSSGIRLEIVVLRRDTEVTLWATPKPIRVKGDSGDPTEIGLLGIKSDPTQVYYEKINLAKATWLAVERTGETIVRVLVFLGEMISGTQETDDLGGILRIAAFSGQSAQQGIANLLFFMAMLSINLGLVNLFPIPVLDGGYLVFYAFEAILGRPLGQRVQEYGLRFGLILVLLLVIFVTWNDLVYFRVIDFIQDLIS